MPMPHERAGWIFERSYDVDAAGIANGLDATREGCYDWLLTHPDFRGATKV